MLFPTIRLQIEIFTNTDTKYYDKTSNNQRLRNAGEDDTFLAIWLMKDLGAHRDCYFLRLAD